ncbi:MAG: methyltransferase domain-containing protein [Thermoplasmata archaeon]
MSEVRGPFDPAARKERISEGWDAMAEKWDSWAPIVDAWFAPATSVLLERLRLKAGDRVLELAAGSGGLTLHLARAVGPEGRVVATDSGPNMVKLAARNARAAGLSNVVARVMDGEAPDVPWASMDAVACRQGFMFLADPTSALGRLFPILRPGGRIGLTVFSTPERNGFMAVPFSILSQWKRPEGSTEPTAEGPGPFSLGAPGLLDSMLRHTGYAEVEVQAVRSPLHLPSVDELLRFDDDILGDLVADLPPAAQKEAWRAVAEASADYAGPHSEGAPCELLVVSGRRPATKDETV